MGVFLWARYLCTSLGNHTVDYESFVDPRFWGFDLVSHKALRLIAFG